MNELSVWGRVRRCALWGLAFGCTYAALATAIVVLGAVGGGAAAGGAGRLWAQLVALYLAGGLAGGAVVGLLWPLAAESVRGEGVVGAVAIFPLGVSILMLEKGWVSGWDRGDWTIAVIFSVLVGGLGGPQVAAALEEGEAGRDGS